MIVFGVTQGMQPILGYNIGADNWNRVKETLRKGIICGLCITTSGWILTETLPDTISNLFTTDPQMIEIAREGFRVYFICYPVVGVQIVIQNFFSVDRQTQGIDIPVAHPPAYIPAASAVDYAAHVRNHRCMGINDR